MTTALLILAIWLGLVGASLGLWVASCAVSRWVQRRGEIRQWECELGRKLTRGEKAALRIYAHR